MADSDRQTKEELRAEYNARLRKIRTYAEFRVLKKEMAMDDIYLYGKRRGYAAFGFCEHPYRPNYIHYLYDDGVSEGNSKPENIWRALKAR